MSPARMDRVEAGMRTIMAFHAAYNRHDLAAIMDLVSADCRLECASPAPDGALYTGAEAIGQFWQHHFETMPQARLEIEEISGLGNRSLLRWRLHWLDANGTPRHLRGLDIFQVYNGQISEQLSYLKGGQ
ncbi:nuclear transport factor 2 family protein [Candidatus Oscillochloris fontis]|uniref:nuclear transport factor 2 family protein n=1 Tax=Candidatus Oscillochloris fontis TaxID=2496868 RepID=UPI00101BBA31|nr:nuclear transport factor 2 family protein [Candidatus Oscillochloris fontis]